MNFDLSEDQRAFQDMARSFAAENMTAQAAEWDEHQIFPVEDPARGAAELGFAAIYCRDDIGGSGLSRLDAAIIFEELAAGCVSTAAYISIHNMASWMIDTFGDDEQRARWLPEALTSHGAFRQLLPDGARRRIGCRVAQDPRGAERRSLRAERHQGIHLRRRSPPTSMSAWCGRASPDPRAFHCIVVEKGTPGLSFGKKEKKLGWNSQPTAAVIFEDCRVPVANRLGNEGDGFRIAMKGLDGGRLNIAACSLVRRPRLPGSGAGLHGRTLPVRHASWPISRRFSSGWPIWPRILRHRA